jgi:hypothetical protein
MTPKLASLATSQSSLSAPGLATVTRVQRMTRSDSGSPLPTPWAKVGVVTGGALAVPPGPAPKLPPPPPPPPPPQPYMLTPVPANMA